MTAIPTQQTLSSSLKVLFIHGGGYGVGRDLSQQPIAQYLRSHFENAHIEHMQNTSEFEQCIRQQTAAIIAYQPHVIITHSQGGPTLLQLLRRGIWHGPSVLCCPAIVAGIDNVKLPDDVPFVIVAGAQDIEVRLPQIDHIMDVNKQLIENGSLAKCVVEDGHEILSILNDQTCPDDNLYQQIEKCWTMYLEMDEHKRRAVDKFAADTIPNYDANTANNTDWFRPSMSSNAAQTQTAFTCSSCSIL